MAAAELAAAIARDDAPALLALIDQRRTRRTPDAIMCLAAKANAAACMTALVPRLAAGGVGWYTLDYICKHDAVDILRMLMATNRTTLMHVISHAFRRKAARCIDHLLALWDPAHNQEFSIYSVRNDHVLLERLMDHGFVPSAGHFRHMVSAGWTASLGAAMERYPNVFNFATFLAHDDTCSTAMFRYLLRNYPTVLDDVYGGRTVAEIVAVKQRAQADIVAQGMHVRRRVVKMFEAVARALAARE